MRAQAPVDALLAQGQALLDAETVLFIDDHQGQALELHLVLEQRMGAHHHGAAGSDLLQRTGARLALELAGQPGDLQPQWRQPLAEVEEVLLGENLRGGHQCHLVAGLQRLQRSQGGDHRLAGANVALHQAQHGFALRQVIGDLGADPLLCTGRGEAQVLQVLRRQFLCRRQGWRLLCAHLFTQALQRQLVGQQFLEGQAVLGPVAAFGELFDIGVGRRAVQIADGFVQRRQAVVAGQLIGQPVRQAAWSEACQRLLTELAQALLGQALGGRVDGGQALFHWRRFVAALRAVLRVIDLQAGGPRTHLTVAAQRGTALEAFLLRLAEMEEAQAQGAAAVLQAHQQAAAPPHDHVGTGDDALDHRVLAGAQRADGGDARAVLVAQRQVEQHVLQVFQADLGEFFRQRGTHAFQRGHGNR